MTFVFSFPVIIFFDFPGLHKIFYRLTLIVILLIIIANSCVTKAETPAKITHETACPNSQTVAQTTASKTSSIASTFTIVATLQSTQTPIKPSPTITLAPPLEPTLAYRWVGQWLKEPIICMAPCFYGIIPGKTTIPEVINIFNKFGGLSKLSRGENMITLSLRTDKNKPEISFLFDTRRDVIYGIEVTYTGDWGNSLVMGLSPKKVLELYGEPDDIELALAVGQHESNYFEYSFRYKKLKTFVVFGFEDIKYSDFPLVCLSNYPIEMARVFIDEARSVEAYRGKSIEKISHTSVKEISNKFLLDPQNVCFDVDLKRLVRPY